MPTTGFRMKSFGQVTSSLINWFSSAQSKVTDLNVGSVARTLLEAVASELAEVYFRIFTAIDTAQEEAVYRSFSFDRKPALQAAVIVLWQRATLSLVNITIPAGSEAAVPATGGDPEIAFDSSAQFILPAGTTLSAAIVSTGATSISLTSTANIQVGDVLLCESEKMHVTAAPAGSVVTVARAYQGTTAATHSNGLPIGVVGKAVTMTAVNPGAIGNVGGATITKTNTAILGIASVTNEAAASGGADEESDDARKKRFAEFVSGLARGTKGAIEFGAKSILGVVSAKAIDLDDDPSLNPGFVNLYVANAAGAADSTLLAAVLAEENNWRPAGVSVTVLAPSLVAVNVTAALTLDPGFTPADILDAVNQRITDFFGKLGMGDDVYLALLYQTIVDTNPAAILNVNITAPTGDTVITAAQIARPGTVTLTTV